MELELVPTSELIIELKNRHKAIVIILTSEAKTNDDSIDDCYYFGGRNAAIGAMVVYKRELLEEMFSETIDDD
jgi:hypothetical protein